VLYKSYIESKRFTGIDLIYFSLMIYFTEHFKINYIIILSTQFINMRDEI